MRYLFVGEKPSYKAFKNGWDWQSGRLAARSLFDALTAVGIEPTGCMYINLFGDHPANKERATPEQLIDLRSINPALFVVALGNKVSKALYAANVPHKKLRHPAARGAGRKRELYAAHVREVLLNDQHH